MLKCFKNRLVINYCKYSTRSDSVLKGFTAAIGNTPLVKLERMSKELNCNILVKCEYMNPGGKLINK